MRPVWVVSLFVGVLAFGAQTAPPAQSHSPTIKVTTHLVEVNVLVHDHRGQPVADLSKDDFEISDQGKLQSISLFSVDMIHPAAATNGNTVASSRPVLPRNVVINRPEKQTTAPTSVTVLLLDMYNTKLTDQMYARQHMIKFLRQIRPEDRIAIYLLNGAGFKVVHDFTNNSETLLASLSKVLPGFSPQLEGSDPDPSNTGDADMDSFLDGANTVVSNFFTRNRVLNTCIAFKALADHLTGIPGRKNLIWLSGGFPIAFGYGDDQDTIDNSTITKGAAAQDRELFGDYIEDASQAMNTANVAVYPVDARGLLGLPMADASKSIKIDPRTHRIPSSMNRVDTRNMDTMNYIADLTGGKAFINTNDLQGAIRRAIDESSVTYTLGYYVPEDKWDDKFHKIKVKVRRGGLTVKTKKGYLAQERPAPNPAKLDQLLHQAVWSPLDSTLLGVSARIDPSTSVVPGSRFYFAVDPSELRFEHQGDKYTGSLDVVLVQETKRGKMIADLKKTLNITATEPQYQALLSKGLTAGEDLKINPDTEAVRIIVLDRLTGSIGSVTVPVTAQDKSSAGAASPVSGSPQAH